MRDSRAGGEDDAEQKLSHALEVGGYVVLLTMILARVFRGINCTPNQVNADHLVDRNGEDSGQSPNNKTPVLNHWGTLSVA